MFVKTPLARLESMALTKAFVTSSLITKRFNNQIMKSTQRWIQPRGAHASRVARQKTHEKFLVTDAIDFPLQLRIEDHPQNGRSRYFDCMADFECSFAGALLCQKSRFGNADRNGYGINTAHWQAFRIVPCAVWPPLAYSCIIRRFTHGKPKLLPRKLIPLPWEHGSGSLANIGRCLEKLANEYSSRHKYRFLNVGNDAYYACESISTRISWQQSCALFFFFFFFCIDLNPAIKRARQDPLSIRWFKEACVHWRWLGLIFRKASKKTWWRTKRYLILTGRSA